MAPDTWDDGAAYEPYVGRWSRLVAARFLHWLAVPRRSAWLDFGCGTGALSRAILADADPRLVIGCDRSAGYTGFARQNTRDQRAQFVVAELSDLPHTSGGFDAVVTGLVLNFLPDPLDAVAALIARARLGGTVAAYVWDYADGMQMMRVFWDAAIALEPEARDLDEGTRFPLCRPEALHQLFKEAGLRGLEIQPIEIPTIFRNFDDFWTPFLGGQGPAPGYARSLAPERQVRLRNAIQGRLPVAADGTIALIARAWAAKGITA
jgi:SAM-dependent methyltransferase